ncbi:MAG: PD-(D/E)XK nuclease family protein [Tannerellaceae bacterium]|jgi:hypothetical protein|nr:PD-(D/E)XK nuclease family protein [Tannerellaceae bacterium]
MKPFLYQVAALFYAKYGAEVSRLAFVFPNRRAGLFFRKYLSDLSDKPLFSPTILTINDLFLQFSGKREADRISMLFTLYHIYIRKSGEAESFDEFLYWGDMLLNDFDHIDKYLVDARMLFTNVSDLREIEADFGFLSEKQVAAIRSFWSSFYPKGDSRNQQEFIAVWKILYELYREFKDALAVTGKGYEGMIFREVVESLQEEDASTLPYTQVVFVGLNALSPVEERLLTLLQRQGIADFYWDYVSPKVTDSDNEASFFVERNLTLFPPSCPLQEEEEGEADGGGGHLPQIEVIGVPSGIGQAKQVYHLLDGICREADMTGEAALRTAVILPDEHLLIPVLHSIPEAIRHINVTMGYPLAGTPVAALVEYILSLQKNIRYVNRRPAFYYRDVLPVLNHPYVAATHPDIVSSLVKEITAFNKIYVGYDELDKTPLLHTLFHPVEDGGQFSDYLIGVLEKLNGIMDSRQPPAPEEEGEDTPPLSTTDLEQEFIFHYFTTVNRLKEIMQETDVEIHTDTYFRLLKQLTDTISIPFRGEPLSGLQIMGVLETRALDFDRLIILSMNEGVFPKRKAVHSFIPYNLRRGFGLPTYEHQDSIFAYYFYRLIHRASRVSLLYDTRNTGLQTGEMSRFIHQLHYHYEEPLHKKLVVYNVSSAKTPAIEIAKSDGVMKRLDAFRKGGEKALSASGINTYLDCPLKFYFSTIEGIREEEEVSETVESDVFGSMLHQVMEELYQPFCGKMVTVDLLKAVRKDDAAITHAIERAFADVFFKTATIRPLTGQNFLIGETIRKYVGKIIERDGQLTPFRYIESEKRIKGLFTLSDGSEIQLKGFIDRVDETGDAIRIIDYKSGLGVSVFNSVEALFDKEEKERPKAIMQVFLYAWMYSRLPEGGEKPIRPGIYYIRTLFSTPFDAGIYHRIERTKKIPVDTFAPYAEDFELRMRECLDELFDNASPFIQTPTGKACAYCPFVGICGK